MRWTSEANQSHWQRAAVIRQHAVQHGSYCVDSIFYTQTQHAEHMLLNREAAAKPHK
jgi:hypothetical protein